MVPTMNRSIPQRQIDHAYPKSLRFIESDEATTATDLSSSASTRSLWRIRRISGVKKVTMLKIIVIFILIIAALLLSFLTYYFIVGDETEDFQTQFSDLAAKVTEQFLDLTQLKVWICYSLSLAYTTEFEGSGAWPDVTLNRFAVKTLGVNAMARASLIAFAPLVTDMNRNSWETYAAKSDPMLELLELSDSLREIESRSNVPTPKTLSHGDYTKPDGIFRIENGTVVLDKGPGPYFPLWQVAPAVEGAQLIMFNQMSDPDRANAISSMLNASRPVVSEVFSDDTFDQAKENAYSKTRGVLYFPVFDAFVNGKVVGAISAEFNWEDNFRYILPAHSKGIICVLENTCGQQFTYMIEGEDAVFLGTGDLHNAKYDDMEESTTYIEFLQTYDVATLYTKEVVDSSGFAQGKRNRRLDENGNGCLYSLHLYPSAEFESLYVTRQPVHFALFVMLIFAFTCIVFIAYDCLVERRQREVTATAARANAIVDSFFPAVVRERVFQTNEKNVSTDETSSRQMSSGSVKGDTPKKRLASFLRRHKSSESSAMMDSKMDPMADPIADLFPDTTIMFADIAGFTAWSSEREPAQVFQLLESVYYSFDTVARQMKVFKLETIGDCYVAATGLPDPDKDHAVIMTRFAFECLQRMKETTQKLETSLGPGTSDLALRVGLHSGPVTGGVLRGEKSRFQLFGDTMNTASRMESNGQRDMIQVSQETADLLVNAGKEHWLTPREDVVIAKGKGEMKTFWIMPRNLTVDADAYEMPAIDERSHRSSGSISVGSSGSRGSVSVGFNDTRSKQSRRKPAQVRFRNTYESTRWGSTSSLEDTVDVKNARLIDWNVNQLLALLAKVVVKRRASDPRLPPSTNPDVKLAPVVRTQLHNYVTKMESLHCDLPFHNFEHTSHVTMSVNKIMKLIVDQEGTEADVKRKTFGISDDPIVHFAVVFSAPVVDVDHRGVPNEQLIKERDALALRFKNKSVLQQNSIKLAWETLKEDGFEELRSCIYENEVERHRFRQLVANAVMATDIKEPKLQAVRKKRWSSAFRTAARDTEGDTETEDRKAKLVIEHVMQAASVVHTMQHWTIYMKWNECLYQEMYQAYVDGRADEDPSIYWYEDELRFLDNHVIPLAKKLKECGAFGGSGNEYVTFAEKNRQEWEMKGKDVARERFEKLNESGRLIDGR